MDPNATWNELKDAISLNHYQEVYDLADSLLEWLMKGGFMPDGTGFERFERNTFCNLLALLKAGAIEDGAAGD